MQNQLCQHIIIHKISLQRMSNHPCNRVGTGKSCFHEHHP